ncbi:MAG: phosphoenolpyruvate--protein phosphotransferase, partial [Lachnospiraceae bacterium]|nr:phosphoenolpyruvate--protein phosphotransferase [Lachnospiraceae bacterium]
MEVYQGHKISGQIAIGTIYLRREEQERIVPETVSDVEAEVTRYEEAVKKAASDLRALSSKAEQNVGAWNARIFEVHAMMTEDVDYREEVTRTIKSKNLCAEYAVFLTGEHFSKMF